MVGFKSSRGNTPGSLLLLQAEYWRGKGPFHFRIRRRDATTTHYLPGHMGRESASIAIEKDHLSISEGKERQEGGN